MLYAHYEGFTKYCWDSLLDGVQAAGEKIKVLSEPYLLKALDAEMRRVKGDLRPEALWDFATTLNGTMLDSLATFPPECRLDAKSNLWPKVFLDESGKLGLTCNQVVSNFQRLKTLVFRRNEIAHGKRLVISSLEDYREYEHAVLLVMHDLALAVIRVIENEEFRQSA